MKTLIFLLLIGTLGWSQPSLNDYNIAVVPVRFDFQKQDDQHKINTHLKMFLEKYGFTVYFDNDVMPLDIAGLPCGKVYASVENNSNMFNTKIRIIIKDCANNVLFRSSEGFSRDKEFQAAYLQAMRDAFSSFDLLNYNYSGKQPEASLSDKPLDKKEVVATSATPTGLKAKRLAFGFDVVNESGKTVMQLRNTSHPEVFLSEYQSFKGVYLKSDGKWRLEYYDDGKFVSREMDVKF